MKTPTTDRATKTTDWLTGEPVFDIQKARQLSKELNRRLRFLKAKHGKNRPPLGEILEQAVPILKIVQTMPSVIVVKARNKKNKKDM